MSFAWTVGLLGIGAGLACLVHAVIPGVCQTSCSRTVGNLQRLFADRRLLAEIREQSSGVLVFVALIVASIAGVALPLSAADNAPLALLLAVSVAALPALYVAQNPALDPV